MTSHTPSNHLPAVAPSRWSSGRAPAPSAQARRIAVESLCRPLTAEELQILRGCAPDEDFTPAA
ncbi:MAG: hypothetical protein ACRDHF_00455 [Tepidiformaceae bacterium]